MTSHHMYSAEYPSAPGYPGYPGYPGTAAGYPGYPQQHPPPQPHAAPQPPPPAPAPTAPTAPPQHHHQQHSYASGRYEAAVSAPPTSGASAGYEHWHRDATPAPRTTEWPPYQSQHHHHQPPAAPASHHPSSPHQVHSAAQPTHPAQDAYPSRVSHHQPAAEPFQFKAPQQQQQQPQHPYPQSPSLSFKQTPSSTYPPQPPSPAAYSAHPPVRHQPSPVHYHPQQYHPQQAAAQPQYHHHHHPPQPSSSSSSLYHHQHHPQAAPAQHQQQQQQQQPFTGHQQPSIIQLNPQHAPSPQPSAIQYNPQHGAAAAPSGYTPSPSLQRHSPSPSPRPHHQPEAYPPPRRLAVQDREGGVALQAQQAPRQQQAYAAAAFPTLQAAARGHQQQHHSAGRHHAVQQQQGLQLPPPRPHSVQPTTSHARPEARPQPPLTPHPAYLQLHHHPRTCGCAACRPPPLHAELPLPSSTRTSAPSPRPSSQLSMPGPGRLGPLVPPRVEVPSTSLGSLGLVGPPTGAATGLPLPVSAGLGTMLSTTTTTTTQDGPPAKRMRTERVETVSPVDLSVRTVRRSADSTAWRLDDDPDGGAGFVGCDSSTSARPTPQQQQPQPQPSRPANHTMPALLAPAPRRTAVMPRHAVMPDFSVAHFVRPPADAGGALLLPRRREEPPEPPPPQVALPGVGTLPWPAPAGTARPLQSLALQSSRPLQADSHSPLLPRFSSNRSRLYPSSSAPALPAHAADPTGYLRGILDGRPPPPQLAAPAPPLALPDPPEMMPARIRTKAEMKMQQGDATAEAIRSWLASSSPSHHVDSFEPLCAEASTSGMSASPPDADDFHLNSAEDFVRCRSLDPLRDPPRTAVSSVLEASRAPAARLETVDVNPSPSPSTATPTRVAALVDRSTAPDPTTSAVPASTSMDVKPVGLACLSPAPSPVANALPVTATSPASVLPSTSLEEKESSQDAWALSCLDFERQLGTSEPKRSPKKHFQAKASKASKTSDNSLIKSEPLSDDDSSSSDSDHSSEDKWQISSKRKQHSSVESMKTRSRSKTGQEVSVSKRKTRRKLDSESEDSDTSESSSSQVSSEEEEEEEEEEDQKPQRTVLTRSAKSSSAVSPNAILKETSGKKALEKPVICTRNRPSGVDVSTKSSVKTRRSASKEESPSKKQLPENLKSEQKNRKQSTKKSVSRKSSATSSSETETAELLKNVVTESVKIRLRTKVVEVERCHSLRPKGDGSDFRPGWEEEVFQYKRSLRMPHVLISLSKSTTNSEGECSKASSLCSANESVPVNNNVKKFSRTNSEMDVLSNCPDAESEDAASSVSIPVSVISRRSGLRQTIVDKLVEKVSRVAENKTKKDCKKTTGVSSGKNLKPPQPINKLKDQPPKSSCKNDSDFKSSKPTVNSSKKDEHLTSSKRDEHSKSSKKDEVSLRAVFGTEKATVKSLDESKKGKAKTAPLKRKIESVPVRQISLRKRSLIIPKPSCRKNSIDGSHKEGIVLRPRNAQQVSCSRNGLRSAALIRRSKVVLNSKQQKVRNLSETHSKESTDPQIGNQSPAIDSDSMKSSLMNPLSTDAAPQIQTVKKRVKLRRKFRSGFDYIRKKKKTKKEVDKKPSVEKVIPVVERLPMTEEQIQVALKNWFINRSHGDTVLHRAARLGYAEVAQYAIEKLKMTPRVSDNAGYTPLHEAARRGHVELSKILLEHGADVSCSAKGGVRPLHEASESNQVEMLRLLLEYGADPTLATYANDTPLSIVEPDSEAHQLLLLHLADVQGSPAPPWKYLGPSKLFDGVTYKGDAALESPPPAESDADSEINVFSSEVIPPPLYKFCGEPPDQLWVLLKDLMKVLDIQTEEEIMSSLSVMKEGEPSTSDKVLTRTREISVEEFLQRTKAVTFSAPLSNLPLSGCTTRLVEYSSTVQALLNEEVTSLSK